MSSQQGRRRPAPLEPSEDSVRSFLEAHPEFFEQHLELLETLRLPHRPGGEAVSLVERQLERLRARTLKAERQLKEFVAIARANEALAEKLHALVLRLLASPGQSAQLALIERELRESFGVDHVLLLVFAAAGNEPASPRGSGFVRCVERDDPALAPFKNLLDAARPRCGRLGEAQREFLFGARSAEVGSLALLPLGLPATRLGLLVLGSARGDHFHPGTGTELLQRIADIVAVVLQS